MMQYDSRLIQPGDTFVCLPEAEPYIKEAESRGAVKIVRVTRAEMAQLAAEEFGNPSKKLTVIGVTGTNGKTTTVHILWHILNATGHACGILGTLHNRLTTPESIDIQRAMADHLAHGGTHFVMEVSSHGIALNRVDEIDFDVRILTNITQDHLDFHKTFEAYRDTKLGFLKAGSGTKIYPEDIAKAQHQFQSPLVGHFNELNLNGAVAALRAIGISDETIAEGLKTLTPPPGRFQQVDAGQSFLVIVDYAHTPDGLRNILEEGRKLANRRGGNLICVFGCGGDRDRGKRPQMGKLATELADFTVITHDNPRTESEDQIMTDILAGVSASADRFKVVPDRHAAIVTAIHNATAADVVVIAGKGHETSQILSTGPIHFDDREVAREAILSR